MLLAASLISAWGIRFCKYCQFSTTAVTDTVTWSRNPLPGKLLPQHWCWHHLDEVILRLRASCFQQSNWIWGRTPLFLLSSWGISGGKSIVLPCPEMKNQRIKALQQLSWRLQNQPQLQNTTEKHRTLHLHPGPKPSHTPVRHAQLKAPKASTNLVCSTLRETVNRPKRE